MAYLRTDDCPGPRPAGRPRAEKISPTSPEFTAAVDEVLTFGLGHPEFDASFGLMREAPWLWNGFDHPIRESTLASAMQMGILLGQALARAGVLNLGGSRARPPRGRDRLRAQPPTPDLSRLGIRRIMTTAIAPVTVATAAKVLRSLLAGRTRIFIAGDCRITRQTVDDIADLYGFGTDDLPVLDRRLDQLTAEVQAGRGQALIDFDLVFEDDQASYTTTQPAAAAPAPAPTRAEPASTSLSTTYSQLAEAEPPVPDQPAATPTGPPAGSTAPATPPGTEPYITALPASLLFVDPTYQRPRDDARVARMVANFDVTQLGVLEVSARVDGRFAIVEGQHRWHAAREAHPGADPTLVCKVHVGLTPAGEAALFYEIDRDRKPLTSWDRYKSRRASGDPVLLEIDRIAAAHGFIVEPAPRDGRIGATGALEKIVGLGDGQLLDRTLALITAAYNHIRDGVSAELLSGVAVILANYDPGAELDEIRLVETLIDIVPRQIRLRAESLREVTRAELPRLTAAVIVDRYNARPGPKLQPLLERLPSTSRLFGPSGRKTADLARIRRWAARNKLPVNVDGTIPKATFEAYNTARATAAVTR